MYEVASNRFAEDFPIKRFYFLYSDGYLLDFSHFMGFSGEGTWKSLLQHEKFLNALIITTFEEIFKNKKLDNQG